MNEVRRLGKIRRAPLEGDQDGRKEQCRQGEEEAGDRGRREEGVRNLRGSLERGEGKLDRRPFTAPGSAAISSSRSAFGRSTEPRLSPGRRQLAHVLQE